MNPVQHTETVQIYRERSPEVEAIQWTPKLELHGVTVINIGGRYTGVLVDRLGVGLYVIEGEWLLRMPGSDRWERVLTDDVFQYRYEKVE